MTLRKEIIFIVMLFLFQVNTMFAGQVNMNVGIRLLSAPAQTGGREIKIMTWYPTMEKAEDTMFGPYKIRAARDAKIKDGVYKLIVISHGSGGSHLGHRDTAIYLAERGYLVAAVLHPENNFLDNSADRRERNWKNRPGHISKALDYILNESGFKDNIDKKSIAIIGYSAGGYTALALAGGIPDIANIRNHCAKVNDDQGFCRGHGFLFTIFGSKKPNIIENTYDSKIKAVVLLAPLGVLFKDRQSLSKVTVPVRIYRAEKDDVLRFPYHAESIRQNLSIKPEYVVVRNACHYSFLAPFPENADLAKDPPGFDRVKFHSVMNREIFEFLSRSLRN